MQEREREREIEDIHKAERRANINSSKHIHTHTQEKNKNIQPSDDVRGIAPAPNLWLNFYPHPPSSPVPSP